MNKYVTVLILVAVLCSMGLVLVLHTKSASTRGDAPVAGSAPAAAPAPPAVAPAPPAVASAPPVSPPPVQRPAESRQASLPSVSPPLSVAPLQPAAPASSPPLPDAAPVPPPSAPKDPAPAAPQGARPAVPVEAGTAPVPIPPSADVPPSADPGSPASAPGGVAGGNAGETAALAPSQDGKELAAPPRTTVDFSKLSPTAPHVLKGIELRLDGRKMELRIEADTPFPCKAFVLVDPPRLVVDLPGTWKGVRAPSIPANRVVKGVRIGAQPAGPRLVLDLEKAPKYEIDRPSDTAVGIVIQ